jgi:phosphoenolpyruvate---glycerone phosphotransferase subunit DhaL
MDAEVFRAWITRAAEVIEANRDHLTQLDAAIGDADHGINLARGFSAVLDALDAEDLRAATPMRPGKILILTGNTIIAKVGGAAGPLYGTAFRRAGKSLGNVADVDLPALSAALDTALAGVQKLGAALEGDKTMVDALAAGTRAFSKAIAEGASRDDALDCMAEAAATAAVATIPMQALKGRASYLGPRSVGHEDPGAASAALIIGALRDTAQTGGCPHLAALTRSSRRVAAMSRNDASFLDPDDASTHDLPDHGLHQHPLC